MIHLVFTDLLGNKRGTIPITNDISKKQKIDPKDRVRLVEERMALVDTRQNFRDAGLTDQQVDASIPLVY